MLLGFRDVIEIVGILTKINELADGWVVRIGIPGDDENRVVGGTFCGPL